MNTNRHSTNKRRLSRRRYGVTLLEMIVAGTMLAMVMTSLSVDLRTSRAAWEANDNDTGTLQHAHAVSRHFVRQFREARKVIDLAPNAITLEMRDGNRLIWKHTGTSGSDAGKVFVHSSDTGEESPLAEEILDLKFTGYKADGVTVTTNPSDVQLVKITVSVELDLAGENKRTIASNVWLRSW